MAAAGEGRGGTEQPEGGVEKGPTEGQCVRATHCEGGETGASVPGPALHLRGTKVTEDGKHP